MPKTNKKNNKKKSGKKTGLAGTQANNGSLIPKISNRVVHFKQLLPDKIVTKLEYVTTGVLNNAGLTTASRSFQINGPYDVDPALGSTPISGFNELSALYFNHRVMKVTADVEMVNRDASVAYMSCVAFHTTGFSANSFTEAYYNNPSAYPKIQGSLNSISRWKIIKWMHEITGDPVCYEDLQFVGTPSATPTSPIYCTTAISSVSTGVAFVAGAFMRCKFTLDTEFFGRRSLSA